MKKKFAGIIIIALLFIGALYSESCAETAAGIAVTVTVEHVGQTAGVEIRVSPKNRRVKAGDTVSLRAAIRNKGNGNDYFILTASSSSGWEVNFPEGNTVGPIEPGRREAVPITVIVPVEIKKGDINILTITSTSQFDPSTSDSSTSTLRVR